MNEPEVLDASVRAWTGEPRVSRGGPQRRHKPAAMVIFDTETDLSLFQSLLVAAYRYVRITWKGNRPSFSIAEEGLVHPDGDDDIRRFLLTYAATHPADVDTKDAPNLVVLSRAEFCERLIWPAWCNETTICGFNLSFDFSRLALSYHAKRRDSSTFVLRLWEHEGGDNRFRPNVHAKRLDNKRTLLNFSEVMDPPTDVPGNRRDHFLDLRTLAFAHTNASHSLESACDTFGVPYKKRPVALGEISADMVDYVREDVAATASLAQRLLEIHHLHPIPISADQAYSPASLGLGYLRKMNVRPPRSGTSKLSSTHLAQAQAAFYGQRTEVRIRHTEVPVTYVDFSAQYATVGQLLGLWDLLSAEEIMAVEYTEAVRRLLHKIDLDALHDPALWPKLRFFAEIVPDGDVLPIRAAFRGAADVHSVGFGPVTSNRPMIYSGPDLAGSKIATGRAPHISRAWALVGRGRQQKLYPVRLAGELGFHPKHENLWAALSEARRRLADNPRAHGIKVVGNALAYGVWLRTDRKERSVAGSIHLPDGTTKTVGVDEDPHLWTFPPFSSLETAGGRLLLSMLEAHLGNEGGLWSSCNTDSATIVSSEPGGLVPCPGGPLRLDDGTEAIRAIPWQTTGRISERFETLNRDPRRPLLRIEPENFDSVGTQRQLYATAVSGGRIFLATKDEDGRRHVVKRSEVNLGDLRAPAADFLDEFADYAVKRLSDDDDGTRPWWWELPATVRLGVGTPGKAEMLGGLLSPFGFAQGARKARRAGAVFGPGVSLVSPLDDPTDGACAPWIEVPGGFAVRVVSDEELSERREAGVDVFGSHEVTLSTFGEILSNWLTHPESKMLGPDGRPCRYRTRGLLTPRSVHVGQVSYVGRESNLIDERAAGEMLKPGDVVSTFATDEWCGLIAPVLHSMTVAEAERRGAGKRDRLAGHLSRGTTPRPDSLARARGVAVEYATEVLTSWGISVKGSPSEILAAYLDALRRRQVCAWPGCDVQTATQWCERHARRSGSDRRKSLEGAAT